MSEDLLYKLRPPVREEFAAAFSQRVASAVRAGSRWHLFRGLVSRRAIWLPTLIGLIVLGACVQRLLSTDFRKVDEIAGTTIYETNFILVPSSTIEQVQELMRLGPPVAPLDEQVRPDLSLEDALSAISFTTVLPTYLPPGYSLYGASPNVSLGSECLSISYSHVESANRFIGFLACQVSSDSSHGIEVSPGKWDVLELGGTQAILERGGWGDYATAATPTPGEDYVRVFWDDDRGYSLYWTMENVRYMLRSHDEGIPEDQFVQIAVSMVP